MTDQDDKTSNPTIKTREELGDKTTDGIKILKRRYGATEERLEAARREVAEYDKTPEGAEGYSFGLSLIMSHWTAPPPEVLPADMRCIDLPFNIENLCRDIDALKAKYDEIVSYMPRVPTETYEKRMAREIATLKAENERLNDELAQLHHKHDGQYAHDTAALDKVHRERDAALKRAEAAESHVQELESKFQTWAVCLNDAANKAEKAEARVERLTSALEEIARWNAGPDVLPSFDEPVSARIAREALKEGE